MSASATEAAGKKCAGSVYCSPLYSSCNELFQLADHTKVMTFFLFADKSQRMHFRLMRLRWNLYKALNLKPRVIREKGHPVNFSCILES